jgi:hypothetical protein
MSYQRLAYDDQDTAGQMHTDCSACASVLGPVPSIEYDDFPREIHKPEINVTDAAAYLAARLHLR